MSTVRTIRLRSGFYVTKDAQYRIVRRRILAFKTQQWHVDHWNMARKAYVRLASFDTLAKAREYVGMCQQAENGHPF